MDDYETEAGPPTQADEDWYWHHVALAQDRPPARNRQGEPMEGQMTIDQALSALGADQDSYEEAARRMEESLAREGVEVMPWVTRAHWAPDMPGALPLIRCWCGVTHPPGRPVE